MKNYTVKEFFLSGWDVLEDGKRIATCDDMLAAEMIANALNYSEIKREERHQKNMDKLIGKAPETIKD